MKRIATYNEGHAISRVLHIEYDDEHIKDYCVDCGRRFLMEESFDMACKRYERSGNYCGMCSGGYSKYSTNNIFPTRNL